MLKTKRKKSNKPNVYTNLSPFLNIIYTVKFSFIIHTSLLCFFFFYTSLIMRPQINHFK